jgi:hypothetical protein
MRYLAFLVALCFTLSPLGAETRTSRTSPVHTVKVKKTKVRKHKSGKNRRPKVKHRAPVN